MLFHFKDLLKLLVYEISCCDNCDIEVLAGYVQRECDISMIDMINDKI